MSRSKVRDTWRTKSWFTIRSPKYLGDIEIGETVTNDPKRLIGRIVEATLYDITGDMTLAHIQLLFQINEIKEKLAHTIFKGHNFARDYLRSLVRRGSTRIDGRFSILTKDGYRLIISTIAFTHNRAKTSQERKIRKVMKEIVYRKAKELTFQQFVHECVLGKIGSEIYNESKKIMPLRKCEVRKSKLVSEPVTKDAT